MARRNVTASRPVSLTGRRLAAIPKGRSANGRPVFVAAASARTLRPVPNASPVFKRVLSLDGGGMRGLIAGTGSF